MVNWESPTSWQRITTIEAHTAGEPLRIITSGLPFIPGKSMLAKRRYAQEHLDLLRRALMWEPRGHADMYGCILTEPVTEDGTLGVLFLHNEGFSTMCGHGVIALATVALDTGLLNLSGDAPVIKMDTPAGRVTATAQRENGRVVEVSFHNVPSFVYAHNLVIHVPDLGPVQVDVAFGGAFYAFCDAGTLGLNLTPDHAGELIDVGIRIKRVVMDVLPLAHPAGKDLGFLYGTIFVGPAHDRRHHSRNVCIFADGEVDRCPTGTGVSARAALHHARGELSIGEPFIVESILGTTFTGRVFGEAQVGDIPAVIPQVTGTAYITGRAEWLLDPTDPLVNGFLIR